MVLLVVATFVSAAFAYPLLPDKIASHWNVYGEVDGYMSKVWGTYFMPVLLVLVMVLFTVMPKIDPFKKNIAEFKSLYSFTLLSIVLFLVYLHALSLIWNLGFTFDFTRALAPALGFLFIVIGMVLPYTKRNWFLGIRTPWTLSSDSVWERTHKAGGQVFVFTGITVVILGFLMPTRVFFAAIALALFCIIWSLGYSYFLYKRDIRTV